MSKMFKKSGLVLGVVDNILRGVPTCPQLKGDGYG